jgi:hypothetical protein
MRIVPLHGQVDAEVGKEIDLDARSLSRRPPASTLIRVSA